MPRRGFEARVRGEMRLALRAHGELTPELYLLRRASGLRGERGGAEQARAARVAAQRFRDGISPDHCETCKNTGVHPRPKKVQKLIAERGLPVLACLDCDRTPAQPAAADERELGF